MGYVGCKVDVFTSSQYGQNMFSDPEKLIALLQSDWVTGVGLFIAACALIFVGAFLKKLAEHAVEPFLATSASVFDALRGVWVWTMLAVVLASLVLFFWVNRDPCARLNTKTDIMEIFQCSPEFE